MFPETTDFSQCVVHNNWPSVPAKYRKMMVDNLLKQGWFQANPTDITIDNIPVVVVPKVMSM